uniref:Elongator acetyltransferase complex subunit 6 n=1 Tax=Rhinopithecus roxellana TaxID=61622 RepID=A0A2K6QMM4_RHIRO
MFVELNNLLNTTPDRAEQGKLTLLCDAKTDGSFLVHHFLSFYLKGCQPDCGAGAWAACVPRGTQVRSGRLLPDSRGATSPAVSQVSQPAAQSGSTHVAGGPRQGS